MKNVLLPMMVIVLVLVASSCKQGSKKSPFQSENRDWRYFGESVSGDTAKLFSPTVISTRFNERDLALSPDGREIFYSMVLPKSNFSAILSLQHDGAFWSEIQTAPFSGKYSDLEPAFSPDGQQLFFVSKRPLDSNSAPGSWNIWRVERNQTGWSEPRAVGAPIDAEGDEYYPSVSSNGNLYFTAQREDSFGAEDIYVARLENGQYQDPVNLGEGVNTAMYEFNAYIAPDESYLLFSSFGREDGLGGGDLYISYRVNDTTWTEAKNLGPGINSEKLDYCPTVSPDGKYLFFTSQRIDPEINNHQKKLLNDIYRLNDGIENGFGNIYWVAFDADKWR